MVDLSKTIEPKSDQLNADDLIGGPKTITITDVRKGSQDQPISIFFNGDNGKPWKPCKGMRRVLVQVWGKDGKSYVGKSLILYRDDTVKWGGAEVGGIRISHMSDLNEKKTMAVTVSRGSRKPFVVLPLVVVKVDPSVKKAGDAAAGNGVEAYMEWLASLDPKVKETVRSFHNGWSVTAKEADMNNKEPEVDEDYEPQL